jgi:catalase
VHARGSAAHGYFEAYQPLTDLTRAAPFQAAGKITPVFVRFSTVAGERGSTDTARDVRGFRRQVLYRRRQLGPGGQQHPGVLHPGRDEVPRPDPCRQARAAQRHAAGSFSAHDTFWDFVSLMPESTHTLMWVMSDRGIPRSCA